MGWLTRKRVFSKRKPTLFNIVCSLVLVTEFSVTLMHPQSAQLTSRVPRAQGRWTTSPAGASSCGSGSRALHESSFTSSTRALLSASAWPCLEPSRAGEVRVGTVEPPVGERCRRISHSLALSSSPRLTCPVAWGRARVSGRRPAWDRSVSALRFGPGRQRLLMQSFPPCECALASCCDRWARFSPRPHTGRAWLPLGSR